MATSPYSFAALAAWTGKELGTSPWVTIGQDRISEFVRSTGDFQ